mmetsp:Transcript_136430/g.308314  ORF Transcript_136430/g.308314 Transcript_136430/m.308314 type:complete len:236 (+) Transcript_136430:515-1222(+)
MLVVRIPCTLRATPLQYWTSCRWRRCPGAVGATGDLVLPQLIVDYHGPGGVRGQDDGGRGRCASVAGGNEEVERAERCDVVPELVGHRCCVNVKQPQGTGLEANGQHVPGPGMERHRAGDLLRRELVGLLSQPSFPDLDGPVLGAGSYLPEGAREGRCGEGLAVTAKEGSVLLVPEVEHPNSPIGSAAQHLQAVWCHVNSLQRSVVQRLQVRLKIQGPDPHVAILCRGDDEGLVG